MSDNIHPFPDRGVSLDPLAKGGGGPHDPGMEARVAAVEIRLGQVENRLERLDTRMDGIDTRLRGVETKLSEIGGKMDLLTDQIVGKLPSWWQMPAVIGSTIAVLAALYSLGKLAHIWP